jgi:hypothetical protein
MPKDLHMYIYVLIFFYHSVLPLVKVPAEEWGGSGL